MTHFSMQNKSVIYSEEYDKCLKKNIFQGRIFFFETIKRDIRILKITYAKSYAWCGFEFPLNNYKKKLILDKKSFLKST